MSVNENWYHIDQIEQLDSPALIVYPARVRHNIFKLISMIGSASKIRPHVKTSKAKETVLLMMEAGIQKFKCATIAEAEMLGICEAPDVLLAYQPTITKLVRFINLIKKYPSTSYACLVDNIHSAIEFSKVADAEDVVIPVYIDLNVGMNRTGIVPGQAAIDLFESIRKMSGLIMLGFHAYDGHINDVDYEIRLQKCNSIFEGVEELRDSLKAKGFDLPLLIAGGSPTCQIHSGRENVEVSPGTFVFWDKGYAENIPEQDFLFAALVVTRVISLPTDDKICIDLGYKSIASENDLHKRVFFLNAPELVPFSHSEEHMVLDAGINNGFKIGDVLFALPIHICPTVALYSHAIIINNKKINGKWKIIARDREIVF